MEEALSEPVTDPLAIPATEPPTDPIEAEPAKDPLEVEVELDATKQLEAEPELIKEAQQDLSKIDILVCGGCHEVYHFIEELKQHKDGKCTDTTVLKCEKEEKSQIWGFTLWKAKEKKALKEQNKEIPSAWDTYQKWTSLEKSYKEMWVTAGRTLQLYNKLVHTKLCVNENNKEKDPLALEEGTENSTPKEVNTAVRSAKSSERVEYNVEKIVGKRFNPRKRLWEYEVKWENYPDETWEPLAHLENCKDLVQEYENKLKIIKDKIPAARGRGRPRVNHSATPGVVKAPPKKPVVVAPELELTPGGRPQRTSKQKAMNQVKAWCGNLSDEESGVKRPRDADYDSDDSFEKKMKLTGDSDTEEDEQPRHIIKKVTKIIQPYNNGSGKLPDNVLIPDARGVVRISQKQLPSLSSGVYIMSKSSGIIKLDPAASKIATSGGQAIVKVNPKLGQTQIRIIKKEDTAKRLNMKPGELALPKLVPKIVQVINKPTPTPKKEVEKRIEATPPRARADPTPPRSRVETPRPRTVTKVPKEKQSERKSVSHKDDESDDGIEELEFPTDLPIPGPDSPPGEFVLDPITGKVVGQDYPDPDPEALVKSPVKMETIDNIVQLAAADITEDDLKTEDEPIGVNNVSTAIISSPSTSAITTNTVMGVKRETQFSLVTELKPKSKPSILNAAIVNSNILQRTLQSSAAGNKLKTQPRIINQSVGAKARAAMSPNVRPIGTPVRSKPILPKPKFNIAAVTPPAARNVYSKDNRVVKKIGQTTVFRSTPPKPNPAIIRRSAPKPIPTVVPVVPSAPKPVISMPSLDDEPVVSPVKEVVNIATTVDTDLSSFALAADDDRPMFITADDGTVYQVAGQNEDGQTILLAQDGDGQQCLVLTNETIQEEEPQAIDQSNVLMEVDESAEVADEQPLIAQFIRTEPPSPGGTHKVMVMMPDGDVMVTQVSPEEYASLELEK